ncbi:MULTISPECIES: chitosanase [unclassified Streptomyces]|uniref:chitosanase n=1 Tax=unclassified Streptomyces TaxID=2593676 RepID=UPI0009394BFC|nr:chitosanase [Streptomyces sp. CB02058]OKI94381.1 chitosanase [Streptomyces sp. CB02058]
MTRLFLFGAPIVIVASILLNGGDSEPPTVISQAAVPTKNGPAEPEAAAETDEQSEEIDALPPGLAAPEMKETASRLVASAEASTLDWRSRYGAIEDIGDGAGYTAGIIGFCSGTNDMLQLVEAYTEEQPDNPLAPFLSALREVDGTDSHEGLDPGFTDAWREAAEDAAFREAQDETRDRLYFDPAVRLAKLDGLGTLGQFIYYDAMVLHGPGVEADGFYGIRDAAMGSADTAAEGGEEKAYLDAFLDASRSAIKARKVQRDTTRIDTAQRVFLREGNLDLEKPLVWQVYGETFRIG